MVALLEITGEPGIAPVPYWKRMVQSLLDHLDHSPGLVAMLSLAILLWILALWFVRHSLGRESGTRLPRQWAVILAVIVALLFGLLLLPIDADAKGQIVQVLGIALPAAVGLASASILGNAIGGLVLQRTANFRLGDFIQVGEHFGRVSERTLLHTEIQTADRDLTTLPNLMLVTGPVKVVRRSGTVVSATVSLGYEIPWSKIEAALKEAAGRAGLDEPFVQVLELGDYSVVYRAAGMCQNVRSLLTVRSNLRVHMLDCLHEADIEILSPQYINMRSLAQNAPQAVPEGKSGGDESMAAPPIDRIFDKADKAQALNVRRSELAELEAELIGAKGDKAALEARRERLLAHIRFLERHIQKGEQE
ncbi:MAG: mechanosensitive ion channel [Planctomycetota bacterium]